MKTTRTEDRDDPFAKGNDGFTRLERAKAVLADLDAALKAVQKAKYGCPIHRIKDVETIESLLVSIGIEEMGERDNAMRAEAKYLGVKYS